jgi:pyrimidine operon attenuation protein / uracil phosphoribosyltransferase
VRYALFAADLCSRRGRSGSSGPPDASSPEASSFEVSSWFFRRGSVPSAAPSPEPRGPNVSAAPHEQLVLSADEVRRTIIRLSHEIRERDDGRGPLVLVGLRTRGIPLAMRLRRHLEEHTGQSVAFGRLDPTLYRDDLRLGRPRVETTEIPVDVDGSRLVLVDDVLFTGRTVRAALDAIVDLGRPALVQLAVLVDRGHRELPIRADFVGRNLPTSRQQRVTVRLQEIDGKDEVVLVERA